MRDGDVTTCASTNSLATRSLWDWQSGHLVCSPGRHRFEICAVAFTPDGRWGLVVGRGRALGTRTAQAWEFINGKPVTPPLGAYGMAHSIVVSPDGARALASTDNKTFLQWLDLADLSAPDEQDVDDLCTLAELTAGQRVYEAGLAGLTSDEWLSRWRAFRKRHPGDGTYDQGPVAVFHPPSAIPPSAEAGHP